MHFHFLPIFSNNFSVEEKLELQILCDVIWVSSRPMLSWKQIVFDTDLGVGGEKREGRKEGGLRQSDINEAAILILFESLNVAAWEKGEREREKE